MIGNEIYDVIVIGGGAAGLSAASTLHSQSKSVLLLEAMDYLGGRIRSLEGWVDFPLELGAEYFHGVENWYVKNVKNLGAKLLDVAQFDCMMELNGKMMRESKFEKLPISKKCILVKLELDFEKGKLGKNNQNMSLLEYFKANNVPEELYPYYENLTSRETSGELSDLSAYGLAENDDEYEGDHDFIYESKDFGHTKVLHKIYSKFIGSNKYLLNRQITSINYEEDVIKLKDHTGEEYQAYGVIITVPLPILKNEIIEFTPPLPKEKKTAIRNLGFGYGGKLHLKFKKAVWAKDICFYFVGDFQAQQWVSSFKKKDVQSNTFSFLISGKEMSDKIDSMSKEEIIQFFEKSLEKVFEMDITGLIEDYKWVNWSKEPFIGGLYSYPSIKSKISDRTVLAKPIRNKIFFAGEATELVYYASIHGAINSGYRAAREYLND